MRQALQQNAGCEVGGKARGREGGATAGGGRAGVAAATSQQRTSFRDAAVPQGLARRGR